MPERAAAALAASGAASSLTSCGLRGLVPPLSLLKTSSPREAMSPRLNLRSATCPGRRASHSAAIMAIDLGKPNSWTHDEHQSGKWHRFITLRHLLTTYVSHCTGQGSRVELVPLRKSLRPQQQPKKLLPPNCLCCSSTCRPRWPNARNADQMFAWEVA